MRKYWFARQFPLTEANNTRMMPVTGAGWAVVMLLAGCLIAGLAGLIVFSFTYRAPFIGVATFVGFALVGTVAFVLAMKWRGDTAHTVAEYRSGQVGRG